MHDQNSSFDKHLCYFSGQWICYGDLSISVDDVGFRQGVVAVERLRTYAGTPFHVGAHLERWQHTAATLHIDGLPDADRIKSLMLDLLGRNELLVRQQEDVGITIFATPGTKQPTFAVHLNELHRDLISHRREQGQPLVVTDIQQPSEKCWPRSIKVRSRIHYYLADTAARKQNLDAVGVLVDSDGNITETSIANLAIVRSGQIYSPPSDAVLGGITQIVIEEVAAKSGIRWQKRLIAGNELRQADEVLLMGTDGGIWFANSVDGQAIGKGMAGDIYLSLRREFDSIAK